MKDNRLTGLNPLAYLGVDAVTPPQIIIEERDPTEADRKNYYIGAMWIFRGTDRVWMLVALARGVATWVLVQPGSGGVEIIETESGIAIPNAMDEFEVLGGVNMNTAGAGNTVTINLNNSLSIAGSLTIQSLAAGVVQTDATGLFFSSVGTDGQVLIGGGTEPNWANITSATLTITNGPNSIDLSAPATGATDFQTGMGTASPVAGVIEFLGGSNIDTAGAGNTVTVNLDANPSISGTLTVTNDANNTGQLTIAGDINFTSFADGVLQSNAMGQLFASQGTDGQILIADTGGAPAWANITSADMSVTITNGPNSINLEAIGGGGGIPVSTVAFLAVHPTTYTIPGGTVGYTFGTQVIMTEIFDDGGGFFGGNGAGIAASFTAPITGYYVIGTQVTVNNVVANSPDNELPFGIIVRPAALLRITNYNDFSSSGATSVALKKSVASSFEVFLTMGDMVTFDVQVSQVVLAKNVEGAPISTPVTYVYGYFVEP